MKKQRTSLRTRISRDANGADTLRKIRARVRARARAGERKSRASFHSINSPNDRDWIYRQVGRNQLSLRIPDPSPIQAGLNEDESGRIVYRERER